MSVWCETTAEANYCVYDVMISGRLGWGRRLRIHLYVIHARSVCLSGYDVVNRFLIVAAADAVESVRSSTLPCAKKRVRESDFVVFGKYQQASTVIVCSSRPSTASTLPSSHPFIFSSPRVCVYQYEQTFISNICSTKCPNSLRCSSFCCVC